MHLSFYHTLKEKAKIIYSIHFYSVRKYFNPGMYFRFIRDCELNINNRKLTK